MRIKARPQCSISDCPNISVSRTWCNNHYQLWRKHGDPLLKKRSKRNDYENLFWEKINKNGPLQSHMESCCWVFQGALANGYGRVKFNGRCTGSHQVAWFLATGVWSSQSVLHRCDMRSCVRFDHLFEGTGVDNMIDCLKKQRRKVVLSVAIVKWIRSQPVTMSTAQMVRELKIKHGTISNARNKRNWRWVAD